MEPLRRSSSLQAKQRQQLSQGRPLLDLISNDWRTNPKHGQTFGPSSCHKGQRRPSWTMIRPPRIRRYLLLYIVVVIIIWYSYRSSVKPRWEEHDLLKKSFDETIAFHRGRYGENSRPQFTDMVQVQDLEEHLIPRIPDKDGKNKAVDRRLIIVGDVHGCKDELVKLLDEVSFTPRTDHLILTGDLISKGPDSRGVVDLVRSMGASCVRGNHEDRVLLSRQDLHSKRIPLASSKDRTSPHQSDLAKAEDRDEEPGETYRHADARDRSLAKLLTDKQAEYLKSCPVILRVGPVDGMGEVVVTHAGIVPAVDLEKQDPFGVMNMRTIDVVTHVPSENRDGLPWTKLWNYYQSHLPAPQRRTVIYGHDSRTGLHLDRYSKGLDTGCVRGGRLTALVLEPTPPKARKKQKVRQRLVSVPCRDYRVGKVEGKGQGEQGEKKVFERDS
ncbi:MAG: hypothetical protein M1817_000875 [Caeruleum heppii]|nr:MAG: hypothetical protein M1817_000875 [Caeruleum heppii]